MAGTKKQLTEAQAEQQALAAARKVAQAPQGQFVRCYVFRVGTKPNAAWDWCLDMDAKYVDVRKGGKGDRRTFREVLQDTSPY
jgi:hypothetical protein